MQNFYCGGTMGNMIFAVPLTGPGGIAQHDNGYIALEATNTYQGGTELTGGQVIYYYNNYSFGTGPITNNSGTTYNSALVNNTVPAAAITITNPMVIPAAGYNLNLVGGVSVAGAPGTTFAGAFTLPAGSVTIYTGNSNATPSVDEISGVISDGGQGGSLVIADYGTMILAGSNTYTGTTTIGGAGWATPVQIAVAETPGVSGPFGVPAAPASSLIFAGGTLQFTSTNTFDYSSRFSYASTNYYIDVNGQSVAFASPLYSSGNAPLVLSSTASGGILTLSADNPYYGGTTINKGATLSVNSIGDSSPSAIGYGNILTLNGGALSYTGAASAATGRNVTNIAGTTSTIDLPAGSLTLNGQITSSAAFTINKTSSGTLTLANSADNKFLAMNISGGTVILDANSAANLHALGSGTTVVTNNSTLQLSGSGGYQISNACTLLVSNASTFDLNGQSQTIATLNLSGVGSGSGALINSSPTPASLTCSVVLYPNTTIGGVGNITLGGAVSSFDGSATSLAYAGSGTLELQGVNTYIGGTIVNSGTLDANVAGSIPGFNVTINNSSTLELDSPGAIAAGATLNLASGTSLYLNFTGAQTIQALNIGGVAVAPGTYSASSPPPGYAGILGGSTGTLVVSGEPVYWDPNNTRGTGSGGPGIWDVSTTSDWFNGTSDATWGTAGNVANFDGPAGTGIVTIAGGPTANGLTFATPGYNITNTDGTALTLGGGAPVVAVPAGNTTISCDIAGGGTNTGLTVTGPGTLTLTGTNSYANGTTVNGATLSVNSISDTGTSAISTGNLLLMGGATLSYSGSAPAATARTITNDGTTSCYIDVPNASLTLNGVVRIGSDFANPAITKTSAGTLYLGGVSNDNSGLTMAINGGEVIITKTCYSGAHGLGGGTSSIASGAELQLAGPGSYDLYSGCILTVASGGLFDVNGQNNSFSTLTLSGAGFGGGGLINSASGTTSLLTNVGSGVVLAAPATIGGPGSITLVSAVSGSGSLTYAGTGTLTMNGSNAYNGGTIINSGATVQLNNTNGTSAGTGAVADNGTMNVNIAGGTMANAISGSGTINIQETSGDSSTFTGSLAGFNGTINCPASPGGAAKAVFPNITSTGATVKIASGGTAAFYEKTCAATVYLNGPGNAENWGSLRIDGSTQSGPVILNANATIGNDNNNSTISGVISDGGHGYGITKTNNSTGGLILTAANTYTGNTTNATGLLEIGGSGCLGATATTTNYAGKIILTSNSSTFEYASTASQTLSGVISGTGILAVNAGTLILTAANTYTGGTSLSNGVLSVSAIADTGTSGIGNNTLTLAGGTLLYTGAANPTTARSMIGVKGTTTTIDVPPGVTMTLSGGASSAGNGAYTIAKVDTGTLVIGGTANNAYFGMNVNGGVVILNKSVAGNAIGSTTVVNTGAELQLSGSGYGSEIYNGSTTPVTVASGGLFDLNGQNNSIYSLSLSGIGNSYDSSAGALINSASGTTSTLTVPITLAANTTIGGTGSITLPGVISGSGVTLTYAGTGTLTLTNTNTYSGGTVINSGTVDVNVTGSVQGNITVNAGATLELDSATAITTNAALTVAAGATAYLNYSGTQNIAALSVGGLQQAPGVYGATASNPGGVFTGTGTVTVVSMTVSRPVVNSFAFSGSSLIWSGTNGPDNGTFHVLTSTNVGLPLTNWTTNASGTFSATGTFSVTNTVTKSPSFFILQVAP